MDEKWTRSCPAGLEVRDDDDDSGGWRISGLACATQKDYEYGDLYLGGWIEQVHKGAFKDTLASDPDVILNINHSDDAVLARTTSESSPLRLWEDKDGLRCEARMSPDDPDAARARAKIRAGTMTEMSFAFRITEREWTQPDGDQPRRLDIYAVELDKGDVSIVTFPASPHTSVSARSAEQDELIADLQSEIKILGVENQMLRLRIRDICALTLDSLR